RLCCNAYPQRFRANRRPPKGLIFRVFSTLESGRTESLDESVCYDSRRTLRITECPRGTRGAELSKLGETGHRQSRAKRTGPLGRREGVETRRAAPKAGVNVRALW